MFYPKKLLNNYFFFLICFAFSHQKAICQSQNTSIDVSNSLFREESFWTQKNNFGLKSNKLINQLDLNKSNDHITLQLSLAANDDSFQLQKSYIKYYIKQSKSFVKIGRYYRDFSTYLNNNLSSGHMLISNNAQPLPKIGYVKFKNLKKNDLIEFKFGISHGVFEKNDIYLNRPMLHEKFIYFKTPFFKKTFLEIGFVHNAMWGGEVLYNGESTGSSVSDYFKVFFAADGPFIEGTKHANALGNHLGIWDFLITKENFNNTYKFYYQHFFEDTSGLRFANKLDGLWGFELMNKPKKINLLIELLHTTNQDLDSDYLRDGYYNHSTYSYGWTYKGFNIGNPFIYSNEIIPLNILHLGFEKELKKNLSIKTILSKRIDKFDYYRYRIDLNINLLKNLSTSFSYAGYGKNQSLGIQIGWKIKD